MYQSSTYAGLKSKSVFVKMSEQSAETARLLQQAGDPQQEPPRNERRPIRRWATSKWDLLLKHLAAAVAPWRDLAQS